MALEELQLFGNHLSGAIPASLGNLVELKLLSLGEYTGTFENSILPKFKKQNYVVLSYNIVLCSVASYSEKSSTELRMNCHLVLYYLIFFIGLSPSNFVNYLRIMSIVHISISHFNI